MDHSYGCIFTNRSKGQVVLFVLFQGSILAPSQMAPSKPTSHAGLEWRNNEGNGITIYLNYIYMYINVYIYILYIHILHNHSKTQLYIYIIIYIYIMA